jgi:hypothetical protein
MMPDIDTRQRGTCAVYAASIALDANHDNNMDLSFAGPDATSANNPDQITQKPIYGTATLMARINR